jgi:hypothetical protein
VIYGKPVEVILLCGCRHLVRLWAYMERQPLLLCPEHCTAQPYVIDPWQTG